MSQQPVRFRAVVWITVAGAIGATTNAVTGQPVDSLRVMTFNILAGGDETGPLSRTVDVIHAAEADVIGLQEESNSADEIALALGFHYHRFNLDLAIVSRYPITQVLTGGVKLEISPGRKAYVFDAHLAAYPYQPYDIRDGLISTEAQAIAAAQSARGSLLSSYLNNFMASALASGLPVFFVGDFNEPSHLDWTQEAADAGLNFGMKVGWPASQAIVNKGLIDAFRALRPDEVGDRGETWTPGLPAPFVQADEVHDRIDFVYYLPRNVAPVSAQVLGYDVNDGNTDIGLQPYPSDHRAVVVEFVLSSLSGDFNADGIVDAADYVVWRKGLGSIYTQNDYTIWRAYFGETAGDGASAAVPEPPIGVLLLMATAGAAAMCDRSMRKLDYARDLMRQRTKRPYNAIRSFWARNLSVMDYGSATCRA
jgi:endonuclease/exonuclease/phosphatase family metal-dependent hydrolase